MDLSNNKYLKEVETILDNWDEKKGCLTTNDIGGVDLVSDIDLKKLGLGDMDNEEILDALEEHYEGSDYHFSKDNNGCGTALIASSSEEIFITHSNELCFPDRKAKSIKLSKENRGAEIVAYSLEWMHDNGIFCSIYELDYYGNSPRLIRLNEMEEYKQLSDDDIEQKLEVASLVEICDLIRKMDDSTTTLGELPSKFYGFLPEVLKRNDGFLEIMAIGSFGPYSLEVTFRAEDMEEEDLEEVKGLINKGNIAELPNGYDFKTTIHQLSYAEKFIKDIE